MIRLTVFINLCVLGLSLSAQSPLIVYDDINLDDYASRVISLGNRAIIGFVSNKYDPNTKVSESKDNLYIVRQDGSIEKTLIIDSTQAYGYGIVMSAMLKKNTSIYHFGSLFSNNMSNFRMIIRKTDTNLNLLADTVFDFGNSIVHISDAVIDSTTILVSGGIYRPDTSFAFILRVNDNMQIVDSVFFPWPYPYRFSMGFYLINPGEVQLKICSPYFFCTDQLLSFSKSPLTIIDTLFNYNSDLISHLGCSFGAFLNDSVYITPVEFFKGVIDTFYQSVGWYIWDNHGNILDSIIPFHDTIMADRMGMMKAVLINNDTIVIAHAHNSNMFGLPSDSSEVGLLFCDLLGNPLKVSYFGSDYNFYAENLIRFDNGNYLVTAQRKNWGGGFPNQTIGFVAWLLNRNGELIQTIELPVKPEINLRFYPNPTTDYLTLQTKDNSPLPQGRLQIFNMQGALQMEQAIPKHQNQLQLNLSHLPAGLYLGRIVGSSGEGGGFRIVKE